jgi:hypothetical protein
MYDEEKDVPTAGGARFKKTFKHVPIFRKTRKSRRY